MGPELRWRFLSAELQELKPWLLFLLNAAPKEATYNDGSVRTFLTENNNKNRKSVSELDGYILFHCGL
jgi:hypothetical protein